MPRAPRAGSATDSKDTDSEEELPPWHGESIKIHAWLQEVVEFLENHDPNIVTLWTHGTIQQKGRTVFSNPSHYRQFKNRHNDSHYKEGTFAAPTDISQNEALERPDLSRCVQIQQMLSAE